MEEVIIKVAVNNPQRHAVMQEWTEVIYISIIVRHCYCSIPVLLLLIVWDYKYEFLTTRLIYYNRRVCTLKVSTNISINVNASLSSLQMAQQFTDLRAMKCSGMI